MSNSDNQNNHDASPNSDRTTDAISRLEDSIYSGEFFTSVSAVDGKSEGVKPLLEAIFWEKTLGTISDTQAIELVKEYAQASKTREIKFNVLDLYALKKASVSAEDIEKVVEALDLDLNDKLMWAEDFKAILGADSHIWKKDFAPAIETAKQIGSSPLTPSKTAIIGPSSRFWRPATIATGIAALTAAALATVNSSSKPSEQSEKTTVAATSRLTTPPAPRIASVAPKVTPPVETTLKTQPKPAEKAHVVAEAPIQPAPRPKAPIIAEAPIQPSAQPKEPIIVEAPVQPAPQPKAPVAVEAAVKPETPYSITLPLETKENGHGGILFDEAASKEAWTKLGFTVTVKLSPEGKKVYVLKDAKGKEFIANIPTRLGEQTTIEANRS